MFGYLKVKQSELLVREYDAYKAVYCGLCKQMGKDYSFLTRFGLSYDCAFYAMLLLSLQKSCTGFNDGHCTFNPLKKCKFAKTKSDALSKASAFAIISTYYKIKDDIMDSGFFKKILCLLIKPLYSHSRKKALKRYPEIDEIVSNMMQLQYDIEHSEKPNIDKSAHPTAYMLSNVLLLEAKDDMQKRIYKEFGYHLGRWIYLIDAADDIIKDKKKNNFNPFVICKKDNDTEYIKTVLNQSLARAYEAYNLIDIKDFKGILDNMMLLGFPAEQNNITDKLNTEVKNEQSL